MRRRLFRVLLAIIGLFGLVLLAIRLVYGGGSPYIDLAAAPVLESAAVERLGSLGFPAGNVTASPDGRIFVNIHPFVQAERFTDAYLFELVDGQPVPYPNQPAQAHLRHVFGMNVDGQGRLWAISPATLDRDQTRIQAFDLATGTRIVDHTFAEGVARFSQDLRVTPDGKAIILADTGAFQFTEASLVVVDLETMAARSILKGHPSTQPQDWMIRTGEGNHTIGWGLITFSVGVDGIAISPDGQFLYYATMSHDTLYRLPLPAVLDPSLAADKLAAQIEVVGEKPLSDGIETTADGEVLLTDIEHGAIVGIRPNGERRTLVRLGHDTISWTDGVAVGPNGEVYFTDSEIPSYLDPLLRPPTREVLSKRAPHVAVYQFKLPH